MVKSYTALRTHLQLVYGKSATLIRHPQGAYLLVAGMQRSECTQEDTLCYGCEQLDSGVAFTLDTLGIKPRARHTRSLPSTLNSFLSRCIKDNIQILRQDRAFQTTPTLLSANLDGDLIINSPKDSILANYATIDIVLDKESEIRLCKLNYVKSNKTEGVYRVILKTSDVVDIDTTDLLTLLTEIVKGEWKQEGWKWKGWGQDAIEKLIKDDMAPMLFMPQNNDDDDVLEKGVWD